MVARVLGQKLGERLGQTVVIENKAGAGTAIGARAVATSAPDGYTLLLGTVSSQAINPAMSKVGYDPLKDFIAVAPVAAIPFVLVANPAMPAVSVREVLALAKASPGKIAYASAGPGTSNHLAGELMASTAGIDLLHVPYKGSAPALNDVLAGHVPMMFDLLATALPNVQSGSSYRVFAGEAYGRVKEIVEKIIASALIYLPSSARDFKNPEIDKYLAKYVRGSYGIGYKERIKVMKL